MLRTQIAVPISPQVAARNQKQAFISSKRNWLLLVPLLLLTAWLAAGRGRADQYLFIRRPRPGRERSTGGAGDYRIALVVYAWETGSRLNAAGLSEGESVSLGAFTIGAR